jgi:hypothetical protein
VAAFEAAYLADDYDGMVEALPEGVETAIAWLVVCGVIFWRPLRREDPVGSAVSAQALLGVLHGLTFPVQDFRAWSAEGHGLGAIAQAIAVNYRAGFWIALAALSVAAVPGYLPLLGRSRRRPTPAAALAPVEPEPSAVSAGGP